MPGTRLNDNERRLQQAWSAERFGPFPLLKSISITAPIGPGLRGIKSLNIDFQFPVTFLSGQNGSGKSTLLALAALGFHGNAGFIPLNSRRFSGDGPQKFGYYTFQDFFYRGQGDADVAGVQLKWGFSNEDSISISKKTDKWMHYERRPKRPVEFLGLSRAIPAIELPTLRSHFGLTATPVRAPLNNVARQHLQNILARDYPSAETLNVRRHVIRRSGRDGGYTSFNMGTGEDALIGLLARLEEIPQGSLVVIEELESGLHPAAQKRAAQALIEIAWNRKLQIIGSTHSHHVLDQLPRQARILVIREADSHRVFPSPSTQFALSEMADNAEYELIVLCEDEFAAGLIAQMLPKALRRRVSIKSCGSNAELALQAQSYLRIEERSKCLILWDGDVQVNDANSYVDKARQQYPHQSAVRRLSWARLPGGSCPELWALDIAKQAGLNEIQALFNLDSIDEARSLLNRCGLSDPHNIAHELAELVGLPEDVVATKLAHCVAKVAINEGINLNSIVQLALDGQILVDGQLPPLSAS